MSARRINANRVVLDRLAWARWARAVKNLMTSEIGGRAGWMLAALIVALLAINGFNVVNSYVGRDFMTAIENRDRGGFVAYGLRYVGVFAALTMVAVLYRFVEERLGVLWREALTRRLVSAYLGERTYYRLHVSGTLPNPDQRIADDVRTFSTVTLSLLLMCLNGTLTVLAFSGVLLSISGLLFLVAVTYAVLGSLLTVFFGRSLIQLNYDQADKEANFRADLIHVRENAESVALLRREPRLRSRLLRDFDEVTSNLKRMIAVNRNLGFFTTGYNYLIQLIPIVIVAPLFMRGEVEFGVITQSAMAFAHLLGAFSLIVTQFQSISSYAAVLARLDALGEAVEAVAPPAKPAIEVLEMGGRVAYERLTLRSPRDGRILVNELSVAVPRGTRLLIVGPNETAKVALFRTTAGLWSTGEGRVLLPESGRLLFLPERPYLPPGTLRQVLVRSRQWTEVSDDDILRALRTFDLEKVLARAGGLDVERDWDDILSLDEQQLLSCARLLLAAPQFVFLDRLGSALGPRQVERTLQVLADRGITYLALSNTEGRMDHYYDAVL
jgi:putative ATP-binding cassette transporter